MILLSRGALTSFLKRGVHDVEGYPTFSSTCCTLCFAAALLSMHLVHFFTSLGITEVTILIAVRLVQTSLDGSPGVLSF